MKLLSILTLILLMSKCKRDERLINEPCSGDCITFKVDLGTDYMARTPVKNIPIELGWEDKRYLYYNPGRLIGTATTSENGTCEISFKAREQELDEGYYYIKLGHSEEYHNKDYHYSYYVNRADTLINTKIHLISKANLKVIFKNFDPKTQNDNFNVFATYKIQSPTYFISNAVLPYHSFNFAGGAFTSKELSGVTAGNDYTYITVNRRINGVSTQINDSIYLAKGETKTYIVEYR